MAISRIDEFRHRVDATAVDALCRELLAPFDKKTFNIVTMELALISAYARVAPGVQSWPVTSRGLRAGIFVRRASAALVRVIQEINNMSDLDVQHAMEQGRVQ